MSEFKFELTFKQRQNVLAARKPYESFEKALRRLMLGPLDNLPKNTNAKVLRRCKKYWPLPSTPTSNEHAFEQHVKTLRGLGIRTQIRTLRKKWDRSCDYLAVINERRDPKNWRNEHDLNVDVVHDLVMADLRTRRTGRKFKLYDLVERACPKAHRLPSPRGNVVLKRLLASPQFMRAVHHVEGEGYFNIILKKL